MDNGILNPPCHTQRGSKCQMQEDLPFGEGFCISGSVSPQGCCKAGVFDMSERENRKKLSVIALTLRLHVPFISFL